MSGAEIFDLYRRVLAIIFGTYAVVRLVSSIWRWQVATDRADRTEALLRRYLVVALLRVQLRRFWLDFVQIAVLAGLLIDLLWLHVR